MGGTLKNKPLLIFIIVVLVVLVAAAAYFLIGRSGSGSIVGPSEQQMNIIEVTPEEIGLSLELSADKQNIILNISNTEGIESFEYEFSYDAQETVEGETITAPKGVLSTILVNSGQPIEREIYLGTCSGRVCRPDIVVGDIQALIRINYVNGEVGAVETVIPFNN